MTWQHKLLYHASVGSRLSELNTCAVKLQNNAACSPVDRSRNSSRRNTSRGTNMTYPENKTSVFRISGHERRTRSMPSSEDPCYPVGSKPCKSQVRTYNRQRAPTRATNTISTTLGTDKQPPTRRECWGATAERGAAFAPDARGSPSSIITFRFSCTIFVSVTACSSAPAR